MVQNVQTSGRLGSDRPRNDLTALQSMTLERRLENWIIASCCEERPLTRQRFRELNGIFYTIYTDPRFWQYRNNTNRDYYEDALSLMWRYLHGNLCTVPKKSKAQKSFLETPRYALGRLLLNIQGHLQNIQNQRQREQNCQEQPRIGDDGQVIDPVDALPNPEADLATRQFDEFIRVLEMDPEGELKDPANTLKGKTTRETKDPYSLTAQTYLLMRHRDDMTIQNIADRLEIPRGALQGGAKPTKWRELAQKYAQMAIDSVSE
jgi:hypothetical protein